jgi:signal peptidase
MGEDKTVDMTRIRSSILRRENIVKIAVLVLVIIIGFYMRSLLALITGSDTPIAVVHGYSMYPLLREGDLVFAYKVPPDGIHVGDIIIYEGVRGRLIIHRVIDVKVFDGKYYYVTKGDNNEIPDIYQFSGPGHAGIPYDRVKGVVLSFDHMVFKIPYLGYLSIWYHGSR